MIYFSDKDNLVISLLGYEQTLSSLYAPGNCEIPGLGDSGCKKM